MIFVDFGADKNTFANSPYDGLEWFPATTTTAAADCAHSVYSSCPARITRNSSCPWPARIMRNSTRPRSPSQLSTPGTGNFGGWRLSTTSAVPFSLLLAPSCLAEYSLHVRSSQELSVPGPRNGGEKLRRRLQPYCCVPGAGLLRGGLPAPEKLP